jgi:catechol 2,3-dioxygenase-like lactoylglutathione lyase family enzyme
MNNTKKIRFTGTLITVADMKRSREFYEKVLRQTVEADYGENVAFEGGFSIHLRPHFKTLIDGKEISTGGNSFELYFECDDVEEIFEKLKASNVEFLHELREHPWRQKAMRFYDPDRNIIEIGETMENICLRLYGQGYSAGEIAEMTGISMDNINRYLINK